MLGTVLGTVVALFIALVRYDNEQNLVPVLTELKIPMRVNRTYRIPDGVKARNKEGLRERGEKATATHSCTLAWKIPWTEEAAVHEVASSRAGLSDFTFTHWRRKWQPTPVFLPGESQGQGAWWAAVYGVPQSRTRLKQLSSSRERGCHSSEVRESLKD